MAVQKAQCMALLNAYVVTERWEKRGWYNYNS